MTTYYKKAKKLLKQKPKNINVKAPSNLKYNHTINEKVYKADYMDMLKRFVAYCEKHGGLIPEFKIDVPYDVVDKIIDDLKQWNKSLIYEDKSLADEIEQFLKKKEKLSF